MQRKGEQRATLGSALDPKHNSLNLLRVVLALIVVMSHAALDGRHYFIDNVLRRSTPGTLAVYGFFGISGYLIASSAERNSIWHYLWQRVLRIAPAFWVALVMTAFFFGPIAWALAPHYLHTGSWHNYFGSSIGPVTYVERNALLKINQPSISGVIENSSLWTLFYEFCCYLAIGLLAVIGLLRHRVGVLVATVALFVTELVIVSNPSISVHYSVWENWVPLNLIKLGLVFLTGSVLWSYRDKVPDSKWLALGCLVGFYAGLWLPQPNNGSPAAYFLAYPNLAAPLIAYPLLWLGAHLPFDRVGRKNDYSYGIYIYAMPVQFVLYYWGWHRLGPYPFALFVILGTIPFAVASWWLVERNALRLKRVHPLAALARRRSEENTIPSNEPSLGRDDDTARM